MEINTLLEEDDDKQQELFEEEEIIRMQLERKERLLNKIYKATENDYKKNRDHKGDSRSLRKGDNRRTRRNP